MWKVAALTSLLMISALPVGAQQARLQVPCPVLLVSGSADHDNIHLSFRNKGKMPIQQISLQCSPAPHSKSRSVLCDTERGLFYPSNQYSIEFANVSGDRRSIVVSVQAAMMGDGNAWISRPSASCRPLTILRRP